MAALGGYYWYSTSQELARLEKNRRDEAAKLRKLEDQLDASKKQGVGYLGQQLAILKSYEDAWKAEKDKLENLERQSRLADPKGDRYAVEDAEDRLKKQQDLLTDLEGRLHLLDSEASSVKSGFQQAIHQEDDYYQGNEADMKAQIKKEEEYLKTLNADLSRKRREKFDIDAITAAQAQVNAEKDRLSQMKTQASALHDQKNQDHISTQLQQRAKLGARQEDRKELQAQIQEQKKGVEQLKSELNEAKQKNHAYQSDISGLNTEMSAQRAKVQDAKARYEEQRKIFQKMKDQDHPLPE
jgi:chromosome segregation ATPase